MKGEKDLIVINPHNAEDYLIDELIEYLENNAWDYRRVKECITQKSGKEQ